jgi:hypothetical protein
MHPPGAGRVEVNNFDGIPSAPTRAWGAYIPHKVGEDPIALDRASSKFAEQLSFVIAHDDFMQRSASLLLLCAVSMLFACGCRPRSSAIDAAPASAGRSAEVQSPTMSAPGNASAIQHDSAHAAQLAETVDPFVASYEAANRAIQCFYTATGRVPADIAELVHLKLIPEFPDAPPGKKAVIDPIKRQVKLVKK